jgi:hypothetical protein
MLVSIAWDSGVGNKLAADSASVRATDQADKGNLAGVFLRGWRP